MKQKLKINPKDKLNFEKPRLILKIDKSKPQVKTNNNAHKKKEINKAALVTLLIEIGFLINKEVMRAITRGKNRNIFVDINFRQVNIFIY